MIFFQKAFLSLAFLLAQGAGVWTCSSGHTVEGKQIPDEKLALLRAEVREVIRPSCGSCHTSSLPTAKPKAVAVFDLTRDDWSSSMTSEQLKSFAARSKDFREDARAKVDLLLAAEMAKWEGKRKETGDGWQEAERSHD
jgi:hypothetical protein